MSYRDALQAALVRLKDLEEEVTRRQESSVATEREMGQLQEELERARREVSRLRGELPSSAAYIRRPFTTGLLVGLGLVVATAVAGYQSERFGVLISYLAAAPVGFGLAGLLGARRSRGRGWLFGGLGAVLAVIGLLAFYEAIWPAL